MYVYVYSFILEIFKGIIENVLSSSIAKRVNKMKTKSNQQNHSRIVNEKRNRKLSIKQLLVDKNKNLRFFVV